MKRLNVGQVDKGLLSNFSSGISKAREQGHFSGGTSSAFSVVIMMKKRIVTTAIAAVLCGTLLSLSPTLAIAEGGSGGGTNIDRTTKEPVDFMNGGRRVQIDPRQFENLYQELSPRLKLIEEKIPGLGRALEQGLDDRNWFITTQEFEPRKPEEEKPINQNPDHILGNAQQIAKMSREQLKKAWFHELVRRVVQDNHNSTVSMPANAPDWDARNAEFKRLSQDQIDSMVEGLTRVLYEDVSFPSERLTARVNEIVGETTGYGQAIRLGYISRKEINERIELRKLRDLYRNVCATLPFPEYNGTKEERESLLRSPAPFDVATLSAKAQSEILGELNKHRMETGVEVDGDDVRPREGEKRSPFFTFAAIKKKGSLYLLQSEANRHPSLDSLGSFDAIMLKAIDGVQDASQGDASRIAKAVEACGFLIRSDVRFLLSEGKEDRLSLESAPKTLEQAMKELGIGVAPQNASEARIESGRLDKGVEQRGSATTMPAGESGARSAR